MAMATKLRKVTIASLLMAVSVVLFFQNCSAVKINAPASNSRTPGEVAELSLNTKKTLQILGRLSVKSAYDHPLVSKMEELVKEDKLFDAALLATETDAFVNIVVRDFAAKMSNREQSATAPLNDMITTIVGIARDDLDAREMLSGDFFYYAPDAPGVTKKTIDNHVVRTHAHYDELEREQTNLAKHLTQSRQMVIGSSGSAMELTDAAGVLTSRAFMMAHAVAGTNRRIVEYAFSQFLCSPIEEWADTSIPDGYVGRDITRMPNDLYKSKCVGCHAPMDALRPAFAFVDFAYTNTSGFTEYQKRYTSENLDAKTVAAVPADEQLVPTKFRRGQQVFAEGFIVQDSKWENFTSDQFGWRTPRQGEGMKSFGRMLAHSRAFSTCMARRALHSVCYFPLEKKAPENLVDRLADDFESHGYKLRRLFAQAISQPECTEGL